MYHTNRIRTNENWLFQFENGVTESVTLPHTWNALDTMEPDLAQHYRRGVGVYKRPLPPSPPTRRQFIHFEAAAMKAQVWLDDQLLGSHEGGYTPFAFELPASGGVIRVANDNLPDIHLIPSDRSDFFLYGGLTRNVWLYETGPVRLTNLHLHPAVGDDRGDIRVTGEVDVILANTMIELDILDENGRIVSQIQTEIEDKQFSFELPAILNPKRWSPEYPVLYGVNGRIYSNGELTDEVTERIGFRTYDFPEGGPFYLNGERLLLRGTHRHEDWAGLGCAIPDELSHRELQQIKDAGFNFIRLGHYPQSDAVLDACDELGLIVWEEIPWCRGGIGGDLFKSRARLMLKEMIDHHFNRPSIIFWGLGNELDWESDHADTTDDDVFDFLKELDKLSHELDPTRLTALRRYDRGAAVVDVYSPSIWSGWYRGRYEDYESVLQDAMSRFPRMIHTEWGGDNHIGRHNSGPHLKRPIANHETHEENPGVALSSEGEARASLDSDWSESYMLDLMEWHLLVQNRLPNLAGTAQWAFKDFGTPLRPENPIPYVNQKGLVDRAGIPKDVYFLFKALQTNSPVCYIESPSWPVRLGEPGELKRVRVYSNCERVELFVNGRSHGTKFTNPKIAQAGGLVWFVPLQKGNNLIKAIATTENGVKIEHVIEQTLVPTTEAKAAAMIGWCEWEKIGEETAVSCTFQLATMDGLPVLNDDRRVCFTLTGPGALMANRGTPTGCRIVETANGRASILAFGTELESTIIVTSQDLTELVLQLGEES